jgi:hypothetical protein
MRHARPPSLRYGAPSSCGQHSQTTWPRRRPCGVGLTAGKAGRFTYSAGQMRDAVFAAKWAPHDYCTCVACLERALARPGVAPPTVGTRSRLIRLSIRWSCPLLPPRIVDALWRVRRRLSGTRLCTCGAGHARTRIRSRGAAPDVIIGRPARIARERVDIGVPLS